MPILQADPADIPDLVALLNSAYRGDASKKGWTTEADLVQGERRTDESMIKRLMQTPGAVFLKHTDKRGHPEACVFLHKIENRLYLGMLSVSPLKQARGTGKKLMRAAEKYAREQGCEAIFIKVISLRHELIAWYERQGFSKTGETEPFPEDGRFGIPTRQLEFVIMEKMIPATNQMAAR